MRVVPSYMTDTWKSGVFVGPTRPIARVTIQVTKMWSKPYRRERYASYLFANDHPVYELPNVKSVKWTRSIDADTGTCEIELYNTKELPLGTAPSSDDYIYNQPGYYTFNRGDDPNRWGHTHTGWQHLLYPDMLIKTYEGYGIDRVSGPEDDPHMMPSGVWLIDDIVLTADGMITLRCRDAARLLLDQICFPPVISTGLYPLKFQHFHDVAKPKVPVVSGDQHWINPTYDTDSSAPYGGPNLDIYGHRASDAFDGSNGTYWLSIGNASPTADYAYEWIQAKMAATTVCAVRINVKGGPYRIYVSLHDKDRGWLGKSVVPYNVNDPVSAPNGSDIRFVKSATVRADHDTVVDVKDTANIDKVRVTFHHLWDSNQGTYQFRAACRDFDILVGTSTTTWADGGTYIEGNYSDYTDIVKWLLGYGGFLWPRYLTAHASSHAYLRTTAGRVSTPVPTRLWDWQSLDWNQDGDPVLWGLNLEDYMTAIADPNALQIGEIWGDLENSNTFGPADLTTNIFDKKPLMDGIAYIRDMLGFIFYIDETGGAIFRSPNVWRLGNWLNPPHHRLVNNSDGNATRVEDPDTGFVHIDEEQTLMGLQATLSGRNIRERIVVANIVGNIGAVTKGFLPYQLPAAGLRRVAIWSDQHFSTEKECQIMADLIAVRQLFTYRTDTITIPGYPAIEIDDQVKITERVTEESDDVHYVKGITSNLDMGTGEWTYQLDTHWLGSDPYSNWAFDPSNLAPDTQTYLRALGKIN